MVVKASPASTFIVIEAQFLLEFLIVALDPPAQFGSFDKGREGCIRRQGREPVFGRRAFVLRPFDEQPLFGIVSLCHKLALWQQGHRGSRRAILRANLMRMLVMDDLTWRSVRIGGSAGSKTVG